MNEIEKTIRLLSDMKLSFSQNYIQEAFDVSIEALREKAERKEDNFMANKQAHKEAEYIEYRVPRQCYEEFGQDLDGCSRQENQGCKGCKCLIIVKGEN